MATTNFQKSGSDLDTLFEPIGGTTKRADVGYTVGGTDISNNYADASFGTAYGGTTGFQIGGVDIGTLFAAIGTIGPGSVLYFWGTSFYSIGGFFNSTDGIVHTHATTIQTNYSWKQVALNNAQVAAIRSDNTLWTWGGNIAPGDSTTILRSSPTQVGVSSWTQVTIGTYGIHAIRSDNTLWGWGTNLFGALGDGTTIPRSSPVQIGSSSWSQVRGAAASHTAGITSDGKLFTWGLNSTRQLGDNTNTSRSSPVQVGSSSWSQVTVGASHTLGIQTNGTLWHWGDNFYGQGAQTNAALPLTQLNTKVTGYGSSVSAGFDASNTLYIWGNDVYGQLGDGLTVTNSIPTVLPSGGTSWSSVSIGDSHVLAIRSDGRLFAWGMNAFGQLGDGTTIPRSSPVAIGTGTWLKVCGGGQCSSAIDSNNMLWTWGAASFSGTNVPRSSPTQLSASSWSQISAGASFGHAIRSDNTLWGWGYQAFGGIGNGSASISYSSPIQIGASSWTQVSNGLYHTAAIDPLGRLFTWGYNNLGQLGSNSTIARSSPALVTGSASWTQVRCGPSHTIGIQTDGTLYGTGSNGFGQIGYIVTTNVVVMTRMAAGGSTTNSWTQIYAGGTHTLGIDTAGQFFSWGNNASGQLGYFDSTSVSTKLSPTLLLNTTIISPTQIGASTWSKVDAKSLHVNAIQSNGSLWGWGYNNVGQIGDGTVTTRSSPVAIGAATDWSEIKTGPSYSVALKNTGQMWAWGYNNGKFGNGITNNTSSPVQIGGTNSWSVIEAGTVTAAIRNDSAGTGLMFLAGDNQFSQFGGNMPQGQWYPILWFLTPGPLVITGTIGLSAGKPVNITDTGKKWLKVSGSISHVTAIRSDNLLFTWGANVTGQLGDGTTLPRYSPTQIGASSWSQVSSGGLAFSTNDFTYGIKSNGTLWSWGYNATGQLGLGDTISRSSPVQVGASSWSQVSAGGYTTHAIKVDGTLWGIGTNTAGTIGDNTTVNRSSPVQVLAGTSFVAVSVGGANAYAITNLNQLFSWGSGSFGALGTNAVSSRSAPVQIISGSSFSMVSAGTASGYAITTNKVLYAWGLNTSGQLGDSTTINRSNPVIITPGATPGSFNMVSGGDSWASMIGSDGFLYATGAGITYGNLGSYISRSSPTLISSNRTWSNVFVSGTFGAFAS